MSYDDIFRDKSREVPKKYWSISEHEPIHHWDYSYDDGTIVENIQKLADETIGHRIVKVIANEKPENQTDWLEKDTRFTIELDNGKQVSLVNTSDCCAHTDLDNVLLDIDKIDYVITEVRHDGQYNEWYILANAFYYSYGFRIIVNPEV